MVLSDSGMALTLSRSKVTRTSPNCKVIGVAGSLKSSSAGRRINWPLSATTNEPLVDLRSRTEALPCASTETMACRFDMDLFVSIMSRRANPSSARGRNGLRPISTLSPLPSFFSSVPSTLTVHCCAVRRSSLTVVGLPFTHTTTCHCVMPCHVFQDYDAIN